MNFIFYYLFPNTAFIAFKKAFPYFFSGIRFERKYVL